MEVAAINEAITYGDSRPVLKVMLDTPAVKEIRISFREGQEMKEHKAGFPIVVCVMSGAIDFGLGEELLHLKTGMMVALEADVLHHLTAREDSIVRLSLIKIDKNK